MNWREHAALYLLGGCALLAVGAVIAYAVVFGDPNPMEC